MRNRRSASLCSLAPEHESEATPDRYLQGLIETLEQLPVSLITEVVDRLFRAYCQDHAVYLFGNGGSAALASHVACDLGKGTMIPDSKPLRVISLCDNIALITAWANDASYEDIFSAQLRPLLVPGDVAFAISGSGNSPNILKGLSTARDAGAYNVGLTGFAGGKMRGLCDTCVVVPSEQMQHIEDSHVCIMHSVFLAFRQRIQNIPQMRAASM